MSASKTKARLLLGLMALGLGGCLSTAQDTLQSWLGTTDANLMASWGAPDRQATAGGGFRVLTYMRLANIGDGPPLICRTTFTVNDDHRVVAATYYCD